MQLLQIRTSQPGDCAVLEPAVRVASVGEQVNEDKEQLRVGKPCRRGLSACLDQLLAKWSVDDSQFERPLRGVFLSFLVLIVAVLCIQNIASGYRNLLEPQEAVIRTTERLLTQQRAFGTQMLDRAVREISSDKNLQNAIQRHDTGTIRAIADKILLAAPEGSSVAEFTIYGADQKPIYSSRSPVVAEPAHLAFQNDLSANLTRNTSNIELSIDGKFVVSVFQAWTVDGNLFGYLKLAVDIERSLVVAGAAVDAELVNLSKMDIPQSLNGQQISSRVLGEPMKTEFNFSALTKSATGLLNLDRFYFQNSQVFIVHELPVRAAMPGHDAKLILVKNITDHFWAFLQGALLTLSAGGGIALLAWIVIRRLLSRLQRSVQTTHSRLTGMVAENTRQLEESASQLLEAQRIAGVGSWERDLKTDLFIGSEEFFRITRISPDQPGGKIRQQLLDLVPEKERLRNLEVVREAIENRSEFEFEHSLIFAPDDCRSIYVRGYVMTGPDGDATKIVGIIHDITDRQKAERQSQLLANILESSLNEIYILNVDTFRIEYANKCAIDNLGFDLDELKSRRIWDINPLYDQETVRRHVTPLLKGVRGSLSIESEHRRKDGSEYPVDLRVQILKDHDRNLFVAIANDVSDRVQREKETREAKIRAERLAYFDPLTKLSNRAGCQRDAKSLFARDDKPSFLIHVDMDGFKRVNDTLGHLAGDHCLEETGRRLREVCRGLGTPYRWGGDEFVILADSSTSDPNQLCERARRLMRQPMEFNGNRFWPTVSMGIALCPDDADSFDTLLVNADLALYQSKENGKDRYTFFKSNMKAESETEAQIELELHDAVKHDQFYLVFQPQVNLRSQAVTGVEALIRWTHPERGELSPGEFLPVVEKSSLAPILGEIVIDKALAAAKSWLDSGINFGRISINVSPAHLASGKLVEHFSAAMERHGVSPEKVTAEVLESVFLNDNGSGHLEALKELYDLGVHIELDDFGTGYASLTHVADLPINGLKIDRSFTRQMLQDAKKEAVVNQLIHLARSLNIGVVCEGVETEAQYDRLRMMGDFSIQGFLIAKPMVFDQVTNWISESSDDLYFVL